MQDIQLTITLSDSEQSLHSTCYLSDSPILISSDTDDDYYVCRNQKANCITLSPTLSDCPVIDISSSDEEGILSESSIEVKSKKYSSKYEKSALPHEISENMVTTESLKRNDVEIFQSSQLDYSFECARLDSLWKNRFCKKISSGSLSCKYDLNDDELPDLQMENINSEGLNNNSKSNVFESNIKLSFDSSKNFFEKLILYKKLVQNNSNKRLASSLDFGIKPLKRFKCQNSLSNFKFGNVNSSKNIFDKFQNKNCQQITKDVNVQNVTISDSSDEFVSEEEENSCKILPIPKDSFKKLSNFVSSKIFKNFHNTLENNNITKESAIKLIKSLPYDNKHDNSVLPFFLSHNENKNPQKILESKTKCFDLVRKKNKISNLDSEFFLANGNFQNVSKKLKNAANFSNGILNIIDINIEDGKNCFRRALQDIIGFISTTKKPPFLLITRIVQEILLDSECVQLSSCAYDVLCHIVSLHGEDLGPISLWLLLENIALNLEQCPNERKRYSITLALQWVTDLLENNLQKMNGCLSHSFAKLIFCKEFINRRVKTIINWIHLCLNQIPRSDIFDNVTPLENNLMILILMQKLLYIAVFVSGHSVFISNTISSEMTYLYLYLPSLQHCKLFFTTFKSHLTKINLILTLLENHCKGPITDKGQPLTVQKIIGVYFKYFPRMSSHTPPRSPPDSDSKDVNFLEERCDELVVLLYHLLDTHLTLISNKTSLTVLEYKKILSWSSKSLSVLPSEEITCLKNMRFHVEELQKHLATICPSFTNSSAYSLLLRIGEVVCKNY